MARNLENLQVQGKYSYTIGAELGRGAFGSTYQAIRRLSPEQRPSSVTVAMKVSHESSNPRQVFTFAQEAFRTRELQHENIVRIDDLHYFEHNGVLHFFFTMPLANRGSLKKYVPKGTVITPEHGVPIIYQSAEALHYAHLQKIIHRDVKPDNILIDEREMNDQSNQTFIHVLLTDFGIAIFSHTDSSMLTPNFGGSLPYMAPEQFDGKPVTESDQYGLAVVSYELFTGQRPFTIPLDISAVQQIILFKQLHQDTNPPPFRNEVTKKYPLLPEIEKIVKKGMAKNPGERYPSTLAFGQAIRNILTAYMQSGAAKRQISKVFPVAKPASPIQTLTFSNRNTLNMPDIDEQERKARQNMIGSLFPVSESFIQLDDREKALEVFDEILRLDPTNLFGLLNKGKLLGTMGKYQEAIDVLDIIPTLDKSQRWSKLYYEEKIKVYLSYGDDLIEEGKPADAVQIYDEVIQNLYTQPWPKDPENELQFKRTGKHTENFDNFGEYLKSKGDYREASSELHEKKAVALYKSERYEDALTVIEETLRYIQDTRTKYPRGMVHRLGDDMDEFYGKMTVIQSDLLVKLEHYPEALEALMQSEWYIRTRNLGDPTEIFLLPLKMGFVHEKLGNYADAAREYKKAITNNPNGSNAYAQDRLGNCLLILREYAEAEHTFETITLLTPTDGNTWRRKGIALENQNKYEEALAAYEKALALMSINKGLLKRKMHVLTQLHRPAEALEVYKQIQNLPKKNIVSYQSRPEPQAAHELKSTYPFSEKDIPAIVPDPQNYEEYRNNADIFYTLGWNDKALEAYDEAIKRNPNDKVAYRNKGKIYRSRVTSVALEAYNQAIKIDPGFLDAYMGKGDALHSMGLDEEALKTYDQVISLDPEFLDVYQEKGSLLRRLQRYKEATPVFEEILKIVEKKLGKRHPDYAKALYDLTMMYGYQHRHEEELAMYDLAISLDPNNADYLGKGISLERLRRYEEAIAAFDQALRIAPRNLNAYGWKGNVLNHLKRYEEAVANYDQAIKVFATGKIGNKDYADLYMSKGAYLTDLGKYEEALQAYEQAAQIYEVYQNDSWVQGKITSLREILKK